MTYKIQCVICSQVASCRNIAAAHCGHIFHMICIAMWMQRNLTCPICRLRLRWIPSKPLFIRRGDNDLPYSHYPVALYNLYQARALRRLTPSEIYTEYIFQGIRLCRRLKKRPCHHCVEDIQGRQVTVVMDCSDEEDFESTEPGPSSRANRPQSIEKGVEIIMIREDCQVCQTEKALDRLEYKLSMIIEDLSSDHDPQIAQIKDESEKFRIKNTIIHLNIIRAVKLLEDALQLYDDRTIRRSSQQWELIENLWELQ